MDDEADDAREYPAAFDWSTREGQDEAYEWLRDHQEDYTPQNYTHPGFVTSRGRVFPWAIDKTHSYVSSRAIVSPLREIMENGDAEALRALHEGEQSGPLDLDQRYGWDRSTEEEYTRLCFRSAGLGHTAMIIYFIAQGADVVSPEKWDSAHHHTVQTPLFQASYGGPLALIEALIGAGSDLNHIAKPEGCGALYFACESYTCSDDHDGANKTAVIKLLIRNGAELHDEISRYDNPSRPAEWGLTADPWVEDVAHRGGYRCWLRDKRLTLIGLRTLLDDNRANKSNQLAGEQEAAGDSRQETALARMFPTAGHVGSNILPKDCVCVIIAFLVDSASSPALAEPIEVAESAWERTWNSRHLVDEGIWSNHHGYALSWSETPTAARKKWRALFSAAEGQDFSDHVVGSY